jgi:hypothetical protein
MKSRGAFSVLMARAGDAENRKVSFEISGPSTPFTCTIRGYIKKSNGNIRGVSNGYTVATGYKKVFQGVRKITTGLLAPGVMGEYDILFCESSAGEVEDFRINNEVGELQTADELAVSLVVAPIIIIAFLCFLVCAYL